MAVEQVGVKDTVMVEVTRAQNPNLLDNWFSAIIILAVVLAIIFIYFKIKK